MTEFEKAVVALLKSAVVQLSTEALTLVLQHLTTAIQQNAPTVKQ